MEKQRIPFKYMLKAVNAMEACNVRARKKQILVADDFVNRIQKQPNSKFSSRVEADICRNYLPNVAKKIVKRLSYNLDEYE